MSASSCMKTPLFLLSTNTPYPRLKVVEPTPARPSQSWSLADESYMMFYHWITLSSMIILMLFIRRNLRLNTLQMLQNGPIILIFILSLMRMVNFSHDYDKRDDFDFPIVHFIVIQTLFIILTPLCWRVCSPTVTYDWFPVIASNRDGCHMWGRKCSLFPEHLILLPLGSSWFHPFII